MWRPRMLVVEDDTIVGDLVTRIAENAGFSARTVTGLEAAATCESFEPDILVLDIFMPDIDGFEVMRYIADHHNDVSIIILSGKNISFRKMAERMGEELGLSIIGNVAKPFTISQLQDMFERVRQMHPTHVKYSAPIRKWLANG